MIVLDTNVFVYASGADHPLRSPCVDLIRAAAVGRVEVTTTPPTLQEFIHVASRRGPRKAALDAARAYLDILQPLIPVGDDEMRDAITMLRSSSTIEPSDALLAAAVTRRSYSLVTADARLARHLGRSAIGPEEAVRTLIDG